MVCLGLQIFPSQANRGLVAGKWPIGCCGGLCTPLLQRALCAACRSPFCSCSCAGSSLSPCLSCLCIPHPCLFAACWTHRGCWQMSTGLPPQPQSADSLTSLSEGTVCLLSCSSCQAGAKLGLLVMAAGAQWKLSWPRGPDGH